MTAPALNADEFAIARELEQPDVLAAIAAALRAAGRSAGLVVVHLDDAGTVRVEILDRDRLAAADDLPAVMRRELDVGAGGVACIAIRGDVVIRARVRLLSVVEGGRA